MANTATMGRGLTAALCLSIASAGLAGAENATPASSLTLELNVLMPSETGCRFTFMVTNGLEADLDKAAFEIVLFDPAGLVDRMTVLDFQDLPKGKTKVRQFDFPEADCAQISRVLINDATECAGAGLDPKVCIRRLHTQTKAAIAFGS